MTQNVFTLIVQYITSFDSLNFECNWCLRHLIEFIVHLTTPRSLLYKMLN